MLLLALAVLALVKKDTRRLAAVGVTFAVVLGGTLWAYWPRPVVAAGQTVQSVDLRTRCLLYTSHFARAYSFGSGNFLLDQNEDYPQDVDCLLYTS